MRTSAISLLLFVLIALPFVAPWTFRFLKGANQSPIVPFPLLQPKTPFLSPHQVHNFTLRHLFHHGTYLHPKLHKRLNVQPDDVWIIAGSGDDQLEGGSFRAQSRKLNIRRLLNRNTTFIESLIRYARISGFAATLEPSAWTVNEISGPDVSDKETIINLATMTSNAYIKEPGTAEWEDVEGGFNVSKSFGWEDDGLRGHVYADRGNQTVIITLKGTTPGFLDGLGTTRNDKVNDNLLCGCCCGQQGHFLYKQVCSCATTTFTCNATCLAQELRMENRYYQAALELYGNVSSIYPNSEIWVSGHSLGGAVGSLLGLTFGLPTVTFEAPGDALAASRLGLPSPPNSPDSIPQIRRDAGIYHIGQTADPVFMGSCNSITSACTLAGYAFESLCHTGQMCVYDTVEDKGWRVNILNHRIVNVIRDVIKVYDKVPSCRPEDECVDCFNWKFIQSNGSKSATSTRSSSTYASTTTCHTPGMFHPILSLNLLLTSHNAGGAVVMPLRLHLRAHKTRKASRK